MAAGDTRAFEDFYAQYAPAVGAFLFRIVQNRDLAEETLQEVFFRFWKSTSTWRGECKVSTYLFQIARNAALDARTRHKRDRARGSDQDESQTEAAAPNSAPGEAIETNELRALVRQAVEALPEDQRLVVHLTQVEGLTFREIAEILQTPISTVKSRMAVAADALRRKLARHVKAES
jgi:RNA polymerase sigma-70 factor (ECF subfamily)